MSKTKAELFEMGVALYYWSTIPGWDSATIAEQLKVDEWKIRHNIKIGKALHDLTNEITIKGTELAKDYINV